MSATGDNANGGGRVLDWPGRVLSLADLRTSLNGHVGVMLTARAVVTPAAVGELRLRGVTLSRRNGEARVPSGPGWGIAGERPYAIVMSVLTALLRESAALRQMPWSGARELAESVSRGD